MWHASRHIFKNALSQLASGNALNHQTWFIFKNRVGHGQTEIYLFYLISSLESGEEGVNTTV